MQKKNNYDTLNFAYGIGLDASGREFYFDKDDYLKIKDFYWRVKSSGYVATAIYDSETKEVSELMLHRYLLLPSEQFEIDHKNHIRCDNRKSNLRIATVSQNQMNVGIRKNNTSGVTGVNWDIATGKWRARISVNRHRISLGCYEDIEDAIDARQDAEKKYYGEWSYNETQKEYDLPFSQERAKQ